MPAKAEAPLGTPLDFALIAAGAACLGSLCVYAGIGIQDGFGTAWMQIFGKKLLKQLLWLVPVSMYAGTLLHDFYSRMLVPGVTGDKAPGLVLLSVGRVLLHFFGFGFTILFGVMAHFVVAAFEWTRDLVLRRKRVDAEISVMQSWPAVPGWFLIYPFVVLKVKNMSEDGEVEIEEFPVTVSRRRLLRWLPAVCGMMMFLTAFVNEDTGERINPYWVATGAAFWLSDYLLTALRVMPALRARRGLPP